MKTVIAQWPCSKTAETKAVPRGMRQQCTAEPETCKADEILTHLNYCPVYSPRNEALCFLPCFSISSSIRFARSSGAMLILAAFSDSSPNGGANSIPTRPLAGSYLVMFPARPFSSALDTPTAVTRIPSGNRRSRQGSRSGNASGCASVRSRQRPLTKIRIHFRKSNGVWCQTWWRGKGA
jgi:hypothetical protein